MLDRNSPVPMYHQVKSKLIDMIHNGDFKVGDKVYSENEICGLYDVSAITAKRVLNELAQEGYISRYPGRGSFVTQSNPISHVLSNFYSFTDEVRRRDMTPSSELVRLEEVSPPENCLSFFDLKRGEKLLLVQRKRFADKELITLDFSYLHCAPGIITREDLETCSLYEILIKHGVVPDKAVESFEAASLSQEDAHLMGMKIGTAVLKVNRQTWSGDTPVEYNFRYYVPNKYIYRIELNTSRF